MNPFEARSLDGPQYFYIGDSEAEEIHRTKSSGLADLAAVRALLGPARPTVPKARSSHHLQVFLQLMFIELVNHVRSFSIHFHSSQINFKIH